MYKFYSAIIFLLICSSNMVGQSARSLLQEGDDLYQSNDYNSAEEKYRKARTEEQSLEANFNLGNAIFKQERYEEAVDHYQSAINNSTSPTERSKSFYNLGNTYFEMQDLDKAIKNYKEAIKQDPTNKEAKYNLGVAKIIQYQQEEQEQQQEQNDENQENNEEQQDQEQQDSEDSEQQNEEQQDQEQQEQQDSEQQEENQEKQDSMPPSPESDSTENKPPPTANFDTTRLEKQTLDSMDALKLLQIIQGEEQKIQEKLRKFDSKRKKPEKDW